MPVAFALILILLSLKQTTFASIRVSVCAQGKVLYNAKNGTCDDVVAVALSTNRINQTGWAYLEVESKSGHPDHVQAYAAGFVEGATTAKLIHLHWLNTVSGYCDGVESYCERLINFLDKNLAWMKLQIRNNPDSPYWHQVRLVLYQLAGISDGYYGMISQPHMELDTTSFLMFQLSGDLVALEQALRKPKWALKTVLGSGSCSAFIKPLPDNRDLVFAHVTWSPYQLMLRILKLYKLNFHLTQNSNLPIPGIVTTFSSYPGTLLSIDDFYLISSGLAVTETTIGNNNQSLNKHIRPTSGVLTWIRVQVANRLSMNAETWVQTFQKRNSGTYNNQWMVVNYKLFKPGRTLPKKGLFYILEQIPYFPSIFNMSGSWSKVHKYGDWFTYSRSPRARIFDREWRNVTDMISLQKLMRYNDYQHDPLSRCNCTPPYSGENAISARSDLNPKNGSYPFDALGHRNHGGTDMKATNNELFKKLQFVAISGPTFDNLPAFQWSRSDFWQTTPHFGHPDIWRFPPVIHKWTTISVMFP